MVMNMYYELETLEYYRNYTLIAPSPTKKDSYLIILIKYITPVGIYSARTTSP